MNKILCFITLLLLIACSSEKPSGTDAQKPSDSIDKKGSGQTSNQPGISECALEVYPSEASRNSTLSLRSKGINLENAKIEWFVNGTPVAGTLPYQFKPIDTKKGDKIQAKATIKDIEVVSNIITIKNTPPEFSRIKIMPEVFKQGDNLYVDVTGTDIDGDEVTILYEWTKNGEPAGNSKRIEAPLRRGDKVSVKITPFDGESYGRTAILNRDIQNMPPAIIDDKKYNLDGKVITYQVKATDPDGDILTYSLKTAPSGMTIDPSTGLIKWDVPPEVKGKTPITISVTDGYGGEALQSLTFEITEAVIKK
jgi:hypothetical protein